MTTLRGTALRIILAAAAALLPLAAARAQDRAAATAESLQRTQMFVTLGWSGRIVADSWTPVVITLQGGVHPFHGFAVIEYTQDATQSASISIPVAATPGKTTEFVGAVCLPISCTSVTCRLVDSQTGRTVQTTTFSSTPTSTQIQLPPLDLPHDIAVASVGSPGGPAATVAFFERSFTAELDRLRGTVSPRSVSPAHLPLAWAGYQGLSVLAVDATVASQLDPRSIAAIREWVTSGGRLVVFTTPSGSDWRTWLPPSPLGSLVEVEEATRIPTPPDLVEALARHDPATTITSTTFPTFTGRTTYLIPGTYGPPRPLVPGAPAATPAPDPKPQPDAESETDARSDKSDTPKVEFAPSLPARLIRLTAAGEAFGWRVRWRPNAAPADAPWVEPPARSNTQGAAGILAEGPVGFGWVTIVGANPRHAVATPDDRSLAALWSDLMRDAFAGLEQTQHATRAQIYTPFGTTTVSDDARRCIMDFIAGAPSGRGAFAIIVVAMIALSLLLGPGDAIILGRLRARHRSWLTALCWIALATAAAYLAPVASRTSSAALGRVSIIDAIQPLGPDAPETSLAWQTSITGVFADRTMEVPILPVPAAGADAPAAWWRGVSAVQLFSDQRSLGAAPTAQPAPDLASQRAQRDPWGGLSAPTPPPRPSTDAPPHEAPIPVPGGNTPLSTLFRTWTFRAFEDEARVAPPCAVRLRGDGHRIHAQLTGLPPGAVVRHAACRTRAGWYPLDFGTAPAAGAELAATSAPRQIDPPAQWATWDPPTYGVVHHPGFQPSTLISAPSIAFALRPQLRRTPAIDALVQTGDWGALYLLIENVPPDAALGGHPAPPRTIVCRLLTPIEPSTDPDPAP